MTLDTHGTLNPAYDESRARFRLYVQAVEPDEEPDWTHKVLVMDHKYLDSEGFPIDTIAGGDTWKRAFVVAAEMVERALNSDTCIF